MATIRVPWRAASTSTHGALVRVTHAVEVAAHTRVNEKTSLLLPIVVLEEAALRGEKLATEFQNDFDVVVGVHSEQNQNPRKGGNEDRVVNALVNGVHTFGVFDGRRGGGSFSDSSIRTALISCPFAKSPPPLHRQLTIPQTAAPTRLILCRSG